MALGLGVVDYSNYIVAGVAAGGAGLAAYRWYRGGSAKKRQARAEYRALWQEVYGSPARVDEYGVEYQPAEQGLREKVNGLSGSFYGHTTHPPHPGRRREDQER